ncbi:hypothetical protein, partial [Jutongia sp.]
DTPPLSHSCISLSDNRLSQAQVVFYRKACDLSTTFFHFFKFYFGTAKIPLFMPASKAFADCFTAVCSRPSHPFT